MEPVNGHTVEDLPVLPVRAGQRILYTPPAAETLEPKPVYELLVPSIATRAAYQRDMVTRCGDYPDDALLTWALKRAIRDAFDGDDRARRLEAFERFQAALAGDDTEAKQEALRESRELEIEVSRLDTRYAGMVAARTYYRTMMPFVVLQHFLVGWTNGPCAFRRPKLTSDECISAIPNIQYYQLSTKALEMMGLTGTHAKN